jgi:hypothetical protein
VHAVVRPAAAALALRARAGLGLTVAAHGLEGGSAPELSGGSASGGVLEGGRQAVDRRQRARAGEEAHARKRRVDEIDRARDQVQEGYSADVVLAHGELRCLRARERVDIRRDGERRRGVGRGETE